MSDDLVKRLRDAASGEHDMTPHGADCLQAADRIAELEAERDDYAFKLAEANNTYSEMHVAMSEANDKLAKAVEALEFYATQDVTYPNIGTVTFYGYDDNGQKARATLAELKGGTDA